MTRAAKKRRVERQTLRAALDGSLQDAAAEDLKAFEEQPQKEDTHVSESDDEMHAMDSDDHDADADANRKAGPRRRKYTVEGLKEALWASLGDKGVALWEKTDLSTGDAPEPFTCVQMRAMLGTVPVPSHWKQLRSFLSEQTDRESCNVVPKEVRSTNVLAIRENKILGIKADIVPFAQCYLTGNPLKVKGFGVILSKVGEVFEPNGDWKREREAEPGVYSEGLRKALGLGEGQPPPWLHQMQRQRVLPPSYPNIQLPGLNAPLPPGASWGLGDGEWGEPVRSDGGDFYYPAVKGTPGLHVPEKLRFGVVPPRVRTNVAPAAPPTAASAPTVAPAAAQGPAIRPMTFQPQAPKAPVQRTVVQMEEYITDFVAEDLANFGAKLVSRSANASNTSFYALQPNLGKF